MTTKTRQSQKKADILVTLKKRLRRQFSKEARVKETEKRRRIRMLDTREWSMTRGNGQIPEWTNINWSPDKSPVMVHRAWYMVHSVPTRVRVKILKSGKKRYFLDIYDHTARKLRESKPRRMK